jgi:hypothetical protein
LFICLIIASSRTIAAAAREIAISSPVKTARSEPADVCSADVASGASGLSPASLRAPLATGTATAAVIHHHPSTVPVVLPVMVLQAPSQSLIVIGTAPLAARYPAAAFRFGDLASMAVIDSGPMVGSRFDSSR